MKDIDKLQKQLDIHKEGILYLLKREKESFDRIRLMTRMISIVLILLIGYAMLRSVIW